MRIMRASEQIDGGRSIPRNAASDLRVHLFDSQGHEMFLEPDFEGNPWTYHPKVMDAVRHLADVAQEDGFYWHMDHNEWITSTITDFKVYDGPNDVTHEIKEFPQLRGYYASRKQSYDAIGEAKRILQNNLSPNEYSALSSLIDSGECVLVDDGHGSAFVKKSAGGGDIIEISLPTEEVWVDYDWLYELVTSTTSTKKATRKTSFKKTAFLDLPPVQHRAAGWDWDNALNGYVTANDDARTFTCSCGSDVESPGMVTCSCGKKWNSYALQTTSGRKVICREVPVRDTILASRTVHSSPEIKVHTGFDPIPDGWTLWTAVLDWGDGWNEEVDVASSVRSPDENEMRRVVQEFADEMYRPGFTIVGIEPAGGLSVW